MLSGTATPVGVHGLRLEGGEFGSDRTHRLLAQMSTTRPGTMQWRRLREDIIHITLPMATRLARKYCRTKDSLDDLSQVAALGLIKAVDRYDHAWGRPFPCYAIPVVEGELKRYRRDRGWDVQVPRRMQDLWLALTRASEDLTSRLHRTPSLAELADAAGASEQDATAALLAAQAYNIHSLNAPVGVDDSRERQDTLGQPDHNLEQLADLLTLRTLLRRLPPREQRIIIQRFYGGQTQTEIAEQLGISQMHVSRLLTQTLNQLRHAMLQDTLTGDGREP